MINSEYRAAGERAGESDAMAGNGMDAVTAWFALVVAYGARVDSPAGRSLFEAAYETTYEETHAEATRGAA
jgi:hypothetical protein